MSEEARVAVQIATLFGSGMVFFFVLIFIRERLQRKADTNVKIEIINYDLGKGYYKLVPINFEDGTVTLKGMVKGTMDKTYPIGGTYIVVHPEGWPRVLQVLIRKMVVSTDTWEPLSKKDRDPVLQPEALTIIRNERFGEQAVRRVQEEAMNAGTIPRKGIRINWSIVLILILLVLLGTVAYWLFQHGPEILAALGVE